MWHAPATTLVDPRLYVEEPLDFFGIYINCKHIHPKPSRKEQERKERMPDKHFKGLKK